jgi:ArsR family transcriptional regulator
MVYQDRQVILLDPIELLDILGNENRRRILQLLSFRPFYFNEMAKRLDVGPKAVIDHLEILEKAGLIECYQDQGRRKYFRIARKTVLEVAVSPHSYGVREYRFEEAPKLKTLELATDMKLLQRELELLEDRRRELRKLIGEIEAREMEIMHIAAGALQGNAQDQLESEILAALLAGGSNSFEVANRLEVPEAVISDRLKRMKERGAVQLRGEKWSI